MTNIKENAGEIPQDELPLTMDVDIGGGKYAPEASWLCTSQFDCPYARVTGPF